ncbi:MAG TPA: DUF2520 domain-containing protein [Xanthomonadales bacterium]|nr:DUF2520 domain-containing protein [Xanthomonadales bacterium]
MTHNSVSHSVPHNVSNNVPKNVHYAILGGGRLARHMRHYFQQLGLPCSYWARKTDFELNSHNIVDTTGRLHATVQPASHVLLLVSDDAIASLPKRYPVLRGKTLVHFSGALGIPGIAGAHPLMTFGYDLYSPQAYQSIPFMLDQGLNMSEVLPGLPNPHSHIAVEHKAQYHALCVMAGNFPQILWQAVSQRFTGMGLGEGMLEPYLRQVLDNFLANPATALTGPLARGDQGTVARNLQSLQGDALQPLYQSFVKFHSTEQAQSDLLEAQR